ncbi:hypothetical protein [Zunongwangia sp. H14]|uniref:hypothetical protein n=1 Tax=Zunongwangia sp. H14 TaxID=3240792 RepID=UPI0035680AD8
MALTDFFRINFPYGLKKNNNNEWFVFNREYMPLGWNSKDKQESIHKEMPYSEFPVYTKYKGLTENAIEKIIKDKDRIQRNDENEIVRIFFYNDKTNPKSNPEYWNDYIDIIKSFSKFEKSNK